MTIFFITTALKTKLAQKREESPWQQKNEENLICLFFAITSSGKKMSLQVNQHALVLKHDISWVQVFIESKSSNHVDFFNSLDVLTYPDLLGS